jgi:hypothetical protein
MKIERMKFRDAVLIGGYEENVIPNGRLKEDELAIEFDGSVFTVTYKGKMVQAPESNAVYWIEAPKPKAAPKS